MFCRLARKRKGSTSCSGWRSLGHHGQDRWWSSEAEEVADAKVRSHGGWSSWWWSGHSGAMRMELGSWHVVDVVWRGGRGWQGGAEGDAGHSEEVLWQNRPAQQRGSHGKFGVKDTEVVKDVDHIHVGGYWHGGAAWQGTNGVAGHGHGRLWCGGRRCLLVEARERWRRECGGGGEWRKRSDNCGFYSLAT